MTSVHEGKKPFKCHICDICFILKSTFKNHVALVPEGNKSFKCGTCNKDFTHDKDLRQLVNSDHGGKEPLKCDIFVAYFADK